MMGNVNVGYGESSQDTAILLLAAAEKKEYEPWVVRHTGEGFSVPEDVAKEAGLEYDDPDAEAKSDAEPEGSPHDPNKMGVNVDDPYAEGESGDDEQRTAKKAAAKKSGK